MKYVLRGIGLIFIASGVTGMIVTQYHISRIKKAYIVVDKCQLEMLESSDRIGGPACAAVRGADSEFGSNGDGLAKALAGFYDANKRYVDADREK